ncbi:CPBP family intramembrane metalloprotease [bacterium]|nr:CPBP family intramembrane metalloprotease [bacterium]
MQLQRRKVSLTVFFALLFAVCWIGTIPMVLSSWRSTRLLPAIAALQVLMLFGPGIVAVFVAGMNEGRAGVRKLLARFLKWRVNIIWYLIVLLGPLVLCLASRQISLLLGSNVHHLKPLPEVINTFATTFVIYFFLNTEEVAWRGYALPQLQERFGITKATLILGIIWGVFHLPLFLMKGGHPAGYPFLLYLLMTLAMTFTFTWVFNNTNGSLLLVHLLHQSLNASAEAIPFYPRATGSLLAMIIAIVLLSLVAIAIVLAKFAPIPKTVRN